MNITNFSIEMYEDVYNLWSVNGLSLGESDTKENVELASKMNPDLFIVGKIKNKVVAVVMGAFDGRRGYVHHLAVDPKLHRQGLGKHLMLELHNRFKEKGIVKVHLFIEVENKGVIEFYKKIGWHVRDDLKMMSYIPKEDV